MSVLATLGRLPPSTSCCGPGKGECSLGQMETAWGGLNSFVHWGRRKKEMNQWLSKSRPICIIEEQEGSADPRSMQFTQSVMCPTVCGKTLLRRSSLKLLLFDPDHILAPRKVAFAFLVGPAKKIQSIRQVLVTGRARTSIGQVVQFLPSAISLWIYSDSYFPLRSLSLWMPKGTLKFSALYGHLATEMCLLCICCFDGAEHKPAWCGCPYFSLPLRFSSYFYKDPTFLFSKSSPSALEKCLPLRAMPPSSECLCPFPRKELQIMAWIHFFKTHDLLLDNVFK